LSAGNVAGGLPVGRKKDRLAIFRPEGIVAGLLHPLRLAKPTSVGPLPAHPKELDGLSFG
jgi:hypothetical protein